MHGKIVKDIKGAIIHEQTRAMYKFSKRHL